jgi:eukaryotic-like serine/threonine-protein kinase
MPRMLTAIPQPAPSPRPGSVTLPPGRRYRVFLSYSHTDAKWARWLMRQLETYRVPTRFHGTSAPIGTVGARIAPVFRDRDELPSTDSLGAAVQAALQDSATLVVICSPAAASSRWVQEEILMFKRIHGERGVFAFIVSGEPKIEGATEDCFSPALRRALGPDGALSGPPAEVVAADARTGADGPKLAFIRLVAGLLGVGFDDLRQRELQRRNRRLTLITAASLAGMTLTLGLAFSASRARDAAQRRQEQAENNLAYMLGDLRTQLEKVGRLDLMESVLKKALADLQALQPADVTDRTLVQHAKALTQIGQIRVSQLRYADAGDAFKTAYERAAELVSRQPQSSAAMFERAQAEYWLANVAWKQANLATAETWANRYRDSALALVQLDSHRPEFRSELVSAHHNLAVLQLERGNLRAARDAFLAELSALEKLAAASRADLNFKFRMANVVSYLGTTAERDGDLAEAENRFGEQVARLEAIAHVEDNPRWRKALADALALHSTIKTVTGQRTAALELRRKAHDLFAGLIAHDPANREWQLEVLHCRVKEAVLRYSERDRLSAAAQIEELLPQIAQLAELEPTNRKVTGLLAMTWRQAAEYRTLAGRPEATEAADRALALGRVAGTRKGASEIDRSDYARSCVIAGAAAKAAGDSGKALSYWNEALALVEEPSRKSHYWRVIEPAAMALGFLGRKAEAEALMAPLQRSGFKATELLASDASAGISVSQQQP